MTRAELLERIAQATGRRRKVERESDAEVVDLVLAEVERQVTPVVEREWCGSKVLERIRGLKATE